jgi:hypothetical protein
MTQSTAGIESGTLVLDPGNLGLDVDPSQIDQYLALADKGMVSSTAGNCGAVQDDRGFRDRTTVQLTAGS